MSSAYSNTHEHVGATTKAFQKAVCTGGMGGPPAMYKTCCHSLRSQGREHDGFPPLLLELRARENSDAGMGAGCSGGGLVLLRNSLPEV